MRERGAGGGAARLSRGPLAEYWMQAVIVPMTAYENLRERDADAPAP
jgi:hypothetical protein